MDVDTFKTFLNSQREGFATFLKGCKDLDRVDMRTALNTHSTKMTFTLATEFPIPGRSANSPFKSPTPTRSTKQTSPSPLNSPYPLPELTRRPSIFKRTTGSTSATPANTPTSKKSADPNSTSKPSRYERVHSTSRGGMTLGGASRLFKSVTPKGKSYTPADDSDSSAGSPLSSDPYPKRTPSSKKNNTTKTPISPFEVAARAAERKHTYFDSESTSDFEIPINKPKSTIRKVSSAKSQMEKTTTSKKGLGDLMDVGGMYAEYDKDEDMGEDEETPSKKQKTDGNSNAGPNAAK